MSAGNKWIPVWLGRFLLLAAGLLAYFTASAQTTTSDAISRELSIFNYGGPSVAAATDAISREVSIFNYGAPSVTTATDASSREVSIFNYGVTSVTANIEAISREVSVFNFNVPSVATSAEAISREVSVFNFNVTLVTTNLEAISREVTIFNFGVPFVVTNAEAISRELSVFNYGVPPVALSIGSTNAVRDVPNQVPFIFQTVLDLTNVSLTLQVDDSHLQILGVTPASAEVISTTLGAASSNNHPITFTLNPAAIPTTNHVLAYLNFKGITNLDSAIVPLKINNFAANRSTGQSVPGATTAGRVILIVSQPILFSTNRLPVIFTLYGLPDETYSIQASTNLTTWLPIYTNLPMTNVIQFLDPAATNYRARFYRAVEQ